MKKEPILAFLIWAMILSCDNERHLPIVPEINFQKIESHPHTTAGSRDTLILYLTFQDGDGDLGLSPDQIDFPYNSENYFYDDNGKLLTFRSRSNPKYAYLPPLESPYNCTNYTDPRQTLYFPETAVDNTYHIVDSKIINGVKYAGVADVIYFENNDNHFNITVDFYVRGANGTFTEFDWRVQDCNQSFDGRFPILKDDEKSAEGILRYTMSSAGFLATFGHQTLKLRVTIKDRALHSSNTIETPEFTL
jgi:hypothetical protein